MKKIIEVQPRSAFRLHLHFNDGVEGEVDLTDLAGDSVFAAWNDDAFFRGVRLAEHGAITWGNEIDLRPDALYLPLTGKDPADLFPTLSRPEARHA